MSKQASKYPKLKLRLKVWRRDGTMRTFIRHSKHAFTRIIKAANGPKYELRVTYAPGIINEGVYDKKKDLLFAYQCFTNKDDVDFILRYNGLIK